MESGRSNLIHRTGTAEVARLETAITAMADQAQADVNTLFVNLKDRLRREIKIERLLF